MKFAAPIWLYAGLAAGALAALVFWRADRQRRRALAALVSPHLLAALTVNFSPARRLVKRGLFIAAVACLFAALARPQFGYRWQEVKRRGTDIVVALDVSRSMLTPDVQPSRLARAKLAIRDLAALADGDRLALIPFAGSAYVLCPPTLDYDMFLQSLDALTPDVMPVPGTDLAAAMQAAADLLAAAPSGSRKILLLFTDGEDLAGAALTEAKRAADAGIEICTIGVGTAAGDLIPVPGADGGVTFMQDERGQIVKSRLDEATLRKIAELTGGKFVLQTSGADSVEKIYREVISSAPKQEFQSRMEKIPLERFTWPLSAAIMLLAVELLLRERRTNWFARGKALTVPLALTLGAALWSPSAAHAAPVLDAQAQREWRKSAEKFQRRLDKKPDDPTAHYNRGVANYQLGRYEAAADDFQKALPADDVKLQNFAYYDLGNAQYRRGELTEQTEPEKTRDLWQQATQAYEGALQLNADDELAKKNLAFVKKRLNELPPPQQNQDDQQQNDQKDQQQQQDQQQQDQRQQQDQQQQNSQEQNRQNQQNQHGQGQQQQQQKSGADGDRKPDSRQNQPPPKPDAGRDQKQNGRQQPAGGDQKQADGQRQPRPAKPGEMSKEQAEAALDALKGEERPYNMAVPNYKSANPENTRGGKDW
ncbi:MAG: VWA domain-containing protein [Verrucomicrobiales bacterium]|jgi:Ca-activated chloride channel family protein|nr:VWA domain-containing protein [Verrucomicrobiales bacterium]